MTVRAGVADGFPALVLAARFDFAARDDLATGDSAVPIAFGYHPYLRLPDVPRPEWRIEVPVHEQLRLGACSAGTSSSRSWRAIPTRRCSRPPTTT